MASSPTMATCPRAPNIEAFCFPSLLQIQNVDDAWVSLDQMVHANDSRPLMGFMLFPTKELPVSILMRDESDGTDSFEHMATYECGMFALQDQLQVVALELTFIWRNPINIQLLGPLLAVQFRHEGARFSDEEGPPLLYGFRWSAS